LNEKEVKVKGFARENEQKEFKEKCELIRGDLLREDTKKVIMNALKGVEAVYAVTDFWDDPKNPDAELKQGRVIMDACKEAGVKHVIFSGLENTKDMSKGKVECECCDKKFEILEYGKSLGLPITEIRLSFYMENFLHRLPPMKRKDGTVVFDKLPIEDKKLDLICAEDIGGIVCNILKNREKFIGKTVRVAGDQLSGKEIADTYSRVTGDKAIYEPLPLENFKQKVEYGEIVAKMFKFYQDFSGKLRDIEETKKLYPEVKTFEQWLRDTKWKKVQ